MKQNKPDKKAVEVNGISFETLVPQWRIAIPKQEDIHKPVQFGLRITNQSSIAYRFTFFGLMPELRDENEKLLFRDYSSNVTIPLQESDFLLAQPGETLTGFVEAQLSWYQGQVQFLGRESCGAFWGFRHLQRGKYEVRFTYQKKKATRKIYGGTTVVEGLWVGTVSTPWVEFRLVK